MSKLKAILDTAVTPENSFSYLTQEYKKANKLRTQLDKAVKQLKEREEFLKQTISKKLQKEGLTSVKTDLGTLSNYEFKTVKTTEAEAFIAWLAEDFEQRSYLLSASPYSKPKVIDFVGEDDLPPGLGWHREIKLSIKK